MASVRVQRECEGEKGGRRESEREREREKEKAAQQVVCGSAVV